ncbi:Protein phosphatase 2a regulatory subunit, partial [Globisporangium splendens]
MNYDELDEGDLRNELENGPTFEDLAIDDSLSDVDRVTKYVCSNIALQRVMHVKMLHDTAKSIGFQATCDRLIPLLEPLVSDVEYVVRQHVAFQFPALCQFLVNAGDDAGYRVILDIMIPLITRLVSDEQHDVRSAASESLVEMAALVKNEDQGQYILTIVLPLAHDDDNEQFRISAVALYNGLAEYFGPELCQQFCVPELISLSEDPVFRVRKSTAQSFSNVCKIAGQELSRERLVPSFQRLARDDIWGVRKACAECLVNIAHALAPSDRGPLLIPLFDSFIKDTSRWVRMAAFQNLGPFLAALEKEHVTDELIEYFLSMATTASHQLGGSGEADIKFHCAFSFPAIVTILGPSEWHRLSPTFELLSNDTFWKIRRTFAHSLHELARVLGQETTENQLSTAFDSYLHDVKDVKLGAMMHFADFLEQVSPSFRESYLPVLTELNSLDQGTKWRFREVLSLQLAQLCRIFTMEATFSVIYPLVMKLVTDPVAVVRQSSFHACPLLIARLRENPEWLEAVVAKFVSLAVTKHFTDRQSYLKICDTFLSPPPAATDGDPAGSSSPSLLEQNRVFFCTQLAAVFFTLASDPVSNVRLIFAETVLAHQEDIKALLSTEYHSADELLALLPARVEAPAPEPVVTESTSTEEVKVSATTSTPEAAIEQNTVVSADAPESESATVAVENATTPAISESETNKTPDTPAVDIVDVQVDVSSSSELSEAAASTAKDVADVSVDPVA